MTTMEFLYKTPPKKRLSDTSTVKYDAQFPARPSLAITSCTGQVRTPSTLSQRQVTLPCHLSVPPLTRREQDHLTGSGVARGRRARQGARSTSRRDPARAAPGSEPRRSGRAGLSCGRRVEVHVCVNHRWCLVCSFPGIGGRSRCSPRSVVF